MAEAYVVFRYAGARELYWTGRIQRYNVPETTTNIRRARCFSSAALGYDEAGECKKLRHFRVGKRNIPAPDPNEVHLKRKWKR